jgi:hypothetical protein
MKGLKLAALLILLSLFGLLNLASANSGNPPLGSTSAPGEQNCTACHNSFGLNTGNGRISIINVPREYKPGQTYNLEISLQDPNASNWGFQLTILNEKGERAGTINVTDAARTELRMGSGNNGQRDYLVSTIAGNFSGQVDKVSWNFDWIAPAQNIGTITFYATGVSGDRDGSQRGDRVYSVAFGSKMFQTGPPTLNFIVPNRGPETGNTSITIRGSNFREGAIVTFDGLDAKAQFVNETTLTATTPPHNGGAVDIKIVNTDGTSATASGLFTYDQPPPPAPKPILVTPSRGPTSGGTIAKLNGSEFKSGTRIIFDGREVATTFNDTNFISFRTPLHNPGPVDLVVINPDGQSAELKNAFIYEGPIPAPIVKLVSPQGGEILSAGGQSITISWTIESNGTATQRLLLSTDGGSTFPVVIASGLGSDIDRFNLILSEDLMSDRARLRLEAVQPEATVKDDSKDFKIVRAPSIVTVKPGTAKAGRTRLDLEIVGVAFSKDAVVEMDGVKLKATVVSSTSIKIKKAPHTVPGSHFIIVRNPNGGLSNSFLFTVAE